MVSRLRLRLRSTLIVLLLMVGGWGLPMPATAQPWFGDKAQREFASALTASTHFGIPRLSADPTCTVPMEGRLWENTTSHTVKGCLNGTVTAVGSSGSAGFDAITSATNTTAAMVVGTGASLSASGSGTITATAVVAGTGSITFTGPNAARIVTIPNSAFTVARTDAANTFTGHQTIEGVTSTGATGTQLLVFGTSPTLTTPVLGVFASTAGSTITLGSGSGTATIGGVICKGAPALATSGTTEEVLATCTIPANTLSAAGASIRITVFYHGAANTNSKISRIRLTNASGTILSESAAITTSGQDWFLTTPFVLTRLTSTTGAASSGWGRMADSSVANVTAASAYVNKAVSITWANSNDIVLTALTGTSAGDATLDTYTVEVLQ